MAYFSYFLNDWDLTIPSYTVINGVTYYAIKVRIGEIQWKVLHRYRDFVELNNVLSSDHGFSKDSLPPKKYFGKQDEAFVETRRKQLEEYLKRTFNLLKAPMPRLLVSFLKIDAYDIFYILESIPCILNQYICSPDPLIQENSIATLSLLQVHALWRCLKLPRPSTQVYKLNVDCSDVLELCGVLERLCVVDIENYHNVIEDSNLSTQNLEFDLSIFKNLKHLTLHKINNLNLLCDASDLRRNISSVCINYCDMKLPADFLYCDQLHKQTCNQVLNSTWMKLTSLDMSFNLLEVIDDSIGCARHIKRLDLKNNFVSSFSGLDRLKDLHYLNFSNNLLVSLTSASVNIKNLTFLDVSGNKISSLKGLEALTKLTGLNLSFNCINDFVELEYISKLPILGYIVLTGNPLSKTVDYRIKVLLEFGDGHRRLQLDNEETTQKELDRVAILLALKSVEKEKLTH